MSVWKPDYIDLDSGAWLASRTRRKLKTPALRGIYWEIIHLLNEAGGVIPYDRADLLDCTLATEEELDEVLAIDHFHVDGDGWLTHGVVTAKVEAIRERLGKSAKGGQRSGETRKARSEERKPKNDRSEIEGTSEPLRSEIEGGSEPLRESGEVGLTDLLIDRRTEGSSRTREQIKPGATSAPESQTRNPGPAPVEPGPPRLDPAEQAQADELGLRIERLVRGLLAPSRGDADPQWPALRTCDADQFRALSFFEQRLFQVTFRRIRGFDFTLKPQAERSAAPPTNGSCRPSRGPEAAALVAGRGS